MNLHGLLNRAQCLASSVSRKQLQKQPETKTVDIDTQWQNPLTQHKNLTSEVILCLSAQCYRFLHNALHTCTMLHNESATLHNALQLFKKLHSTRTTCNPA
jgi:hypothetical protein